MSKPLAVVKTLDHLVLTCASVPKTIQWYSKHLGMKHNTFGPGSNNSVQRQALKFGPHKINLHQKGKEFKPKAATALPVTADLCFIVEDDMNLENGILGFQKEGV